MKLRNSARAIARIATAFSASFAEKKGIIHRIFAEKGLIRGDRRRKNGRKWAFLLGIEGKRRAERTER